jgi:hypothetical protein
MGATVMQRWTSDAPGHGARVLACGILQALGKRVAKAVQQVTVDLGLVGDQSCELRN